MRLGLAAVLIPAVLLLAAQPFVDAPVNDDWQMYLSAFRFAETGELRIPDYSAMGMVGWTSLGGVVSAVTGPSFVALRFLTMTLHVVAGWMAYRAAREWGIDRSRSLAVSVLVSTSPVLFWLATSYMTDAPWHAAWVAAIWAWTHALRHGSPRVFLAGALVAAWAAWIRIPAVALPLALAFVAWRSPIAPAPRRRAWVAVAVSLLLGPVAFHVWYHHVHGPTSAYLAKSTIEPAEMLARVPGGAFAAVAYLGLFLLPIAPVLLRGRISRGTILSALAMSAAVAAVAIVHARTGLLGISTRKSLPFLPNVLFNAGLGPLTVTDVLREGGPTPVHFPAVVQVLLGVVAAGVGGALTWVLGRRLLFREEDPRSTLVGGATLLYVGAAIVFSKQSAPLFDRYLAPMILPAALVLLRANQEPPPVARRASTALLAVAGLFSVVATHDYHRFAAARARLLVQARATGVSVRRIDGGFEFGGYENYEAARAGAFTPDPAWKGWWVESPDLVVATRERDGYRVLAREPVLSLLGARHWDLLLLERSDR